MPVQPIEDNPYALPPTPPESPPTARDIASGIRYETRILQSYFGSSHLVNVSLHLLIKSLQRERRRSR